MPDIIKFYAQRKNEYERMRGTLFVGPPLWETGGVVPMTTWRDVMNFYNEMVDAIWSGPDLKKYPAMSKEWEAFKKNSPVSKAFDLYGWFKAPQEIIRNQDMVYPYNAEFWQKAKRAAIARSSLGAIPSWSTMAAESIAESWEDLKKKTKKVGDDMGFGIFKDLAAILKWGTIGGIAFAGYWYILRPKGKQKRLSR